MWHHFKTSAFCNFIVLIFFALCSCKHEKINSKGLPNSETYCDSSDVILNAASIEGYSHKLSYEPGDIIQFKIHSLNPIHNIEIARYGATVEIVHQAAGIPGIKQNYHCYSYSYGCRWLTTYEVKIEPTWNSGLYSAKLVNPSDNKIAWVTFVVRKPAAQLEKDILMISSTNTWAAYNDWGGGSFYDFPMDENVLGSENVSFQRPNKYADPTSVGGHLVGSETYLFKWMEINGYTWDHATDRDLHDAADLLSPYKCVIIQTHPEYYTKEMYDKLYRYVQHGGHLAYLGGNAIWGKVVIDPVRDILEIRRNYQVHTYEKSIGGLWRHLDLPESRLLGVQYSESGYLTWKPYRVINSAHWAFAGTGVVNGDLFGDDCLDTQGASGHETDKLTIYSSQIPGILLLAKGTNPNNGGADMIYYQTLSGGEVFSVGSISFTTCLLTDSVQSKIVKNVLNRFIQ